MEKLPLEVIGNILSHVGAARDVIIASLTCRKWREASRRHVSTLSFCVNDYPIFKDLPSSLLEILITRSIFQTVGLQHLSINMDDLVTFSSSPFLAWLLFTRETLKSLSYRVRTTPHLNILDLCGAHRLENLSLARNSIVCSTHLKFPCLRSVSLSDVAISQADVSLLLASCPKLESLDLISLQISAQACLELTSPSLKNVLVEGFNLEKFLLEAESLEILRVKELTLDVFEFSGKGFLKRLQLDDVSAMHLELGESFEDLEVVEVSNFTLSWGKFWEMMSRSSGIKRLKLWGVVFEEDDEVLEMDAVAACFPELCELCLSLEVSEGVRGEHVLGSLTLLEVEWSAKKSKDFSNWVEGVLGRCPNLRLFVVHGAISEVKSHEDCQSLAEFMSFLVTLMRKYFQVEVRYEFE